jgi:hypothetical protein
MVTKEESGSDQIRLLHKSVESYGKADMGLTSAEEREERVSETHHTVERCTSSVK